MIVAHLAMIAVLGLAPGAEPTDLVARLGSPRFAEREAAASALERLGRGALPALRGAVGSKDPEVRTRAADLATRIERELMVRPTTVTLDFRDRPLDEVVRAVADRSGIAVALVPENAALWQGRRVTLEEPQPVPFWAAIDKLCRAGQLAYSPVLQMGANGRRLVLQASAGGGPSTPMVDSGPFRVSLIRFDHHRALDFNTPAAGAPARILVGGLGGLPQIRAADPAPAKPAFSEQFSLSMLVAAEPRLMISQGGALKLSEAIDDRGQSLLPQEPTGAMMQRSSGYSGYGSNLSSLQLQIPLKLPETPGRFIKTLRGSLPLAVSAPKADPLVIPLAGAAGKTFRAADAALTIHGVTDDPMQPRATVDLTVRNEGRPDLAVPGSPEFFGNRAPEMVQNRIEILDARGKVLQAFPTRTQATSSETRMTLMILPADGGVPTHIRYYDLARATAEATFEFTGIPIP